MIDKVVRQGVSSALGLAEFLLTRSLEAVRLVNEALAEDDAAPPGMLDGYGAGAAQPSWRPAELGDLAATAAILRDRARSNVTELPTTLPDDTPARARDDTAARVPSADGSPGATRSAGPGDDAGSVPARPRPSRAAIRQRASAATDRAPAPVSADTDPTLSTSADGGAAPRRRTATKKRTSTQQPTGTRRRSTTKTQSATHQPSSTKTTARSPRKRAAAAADEPVGAPTRASGPTPASGQS
ncbi:MAG: hypothetical protein V9G19_18135 [Tetrasphaera sp.]